VIRDNDSVQNGDAICIHGAREHNLKNVSLAIPRNKFVVITGVSGSGKSTLAFDLLFAEGQRRFLDSMNTYARQFVEQMARPDVDLITGIPPTVSIEQRTSRGGGKSTVATVTEAYHFLRLLFARLGTQYCPDCQLPVEAQTRSSISARATLVNESAMTSILYQISNNQAHRRLSTKNALQGVLHGNMQLRPADVSAVNGKLNGLLLLSALHNGNADAGQPDYFKIVSKMLSLIQLG